MVHGMNDQFPIVIRRLRHIGCTAAGDTKKERDFSALAILDQIPELSNHPDGFVVRGRYCVSFAVLDAINNLRPQGTSVQQLNKCICDMKGTRYVVTSRAKDSTRAARSAFDKPHDEQARKTESRPGASGPIRLRSIAGDGPLHSECEAPPAAMPGSILWTTTAVEPSSPPTRVCNSELTFNVSNYAAGPCADCGSKSKHKRS